MSTGDRFWSKVDTGAPGGCWLWTDAPGHYGYGKFYVGGKHARAHRFAYEFLVGDVPAGLVLDHLCRNRMCVNPGHMEPVTNRENILRGKSPSARHARKTHCVNGHAFDEANTYKTRKGGRLCRACRREGMRRSRRRRS